MATVGVKGLNSIMCLLICGIWLSIAHVTNPFSLLRSWPAWGSGFQSTWKRSSTDGRWVSRCGPAREWQL